MKGTTMKYFGAAVLSLGLLAGLGMGQTTSGTGRDGDTATTNRQDTGSRADGSGFNPGWLGLIGLIGLAGLMPKGRDDRTHHSTTGMGTAQR
jgi:hypothetical protein